MIRDLVRGLSRPSAASQTPEEALVRGLAHTVLGGALSPLPLLLVAVCYGLKEANDLRQGGDPVDGAFDVAFVAVGVVVLPVHPAAGCAAAIALGLVHAAVAWRRS